ncbi:hypothetical protein BGZ80_009465 [Entomortierella chlamydospora]|uniref:Zn(2)-C6 fungal-type domain-containing protein n=1 Tax=Entomortierella chlamydospora TaxID=101097 RepID=A0A9P6T444_9FUNG|nr:hypothetical protein BGZ80_009465 [Entomortierella chlamydospora]
MNNSQQRDNSSATEGANSNENKSQQQLNDDATADAKKKRAGPKRRKVTHACVYCRRSHMTCDDGRPCQRCIKRNIGHLCHDEPKPSQLANSQGAASSSGNEAKKIPQHQQQQQQQPQQQQQAQSSNNTQPNQIQTQSQQQYQQLQHVQQSMNNMPLYGFGSQLSALPVTPLTFASEHMGNEFTSLGGDQRNLFSDQGVPVNTTEKFFLTAANPGDGTNEDRLTQVINAKFEAGFLKPYNYVNGYSRLQRYMDSK